MLLATSLTLTTLAAGALVGARNRKNWFHLIRTLESNCTSEAKTASDKVDESKQGTTAAWESLPPIVRHYFNSVFSSVKFDMHRETKLLSPLEFSPPMIESVRFGQVGKFKQKNDWLPMSAAQTIGTRAGNPGFVWHADMSMANGWWKRWLPKVLVCDAWINGEGHLLASMHGMVPLVTDKAFKDHQPELQKGEMMRFLAEAFLTPTVLLPEAGVVTWKATDDEHTVVLSMKSLTDDMACKVEVTFVDDSIAVKGVRPKAEGTSFASLPWGGKMSNFQRVDDMWIPTHMECGWINPQTGDLELYFVADNSGFEFDRAAVSSST